jgi:ATP-dependent RNA helicase RhlE
MPFCCSLQFNLSNPKDDLGLQPYPIQEKLFVIMSGRDMMGIQINKKHLPIYSLLKLYKFIPGHTPKIVILVPTANL